MKQLVVMFVVVEEGERPHPFDIETSPIIDVVAQGRLHAGGLQDVLDAVERAVRREAAKP